jgi:hypothetical protein
MTNSERGTGRTKAQMLDAPHKAIFVWCNGQLHYPRVLARHLGRTDLEIVSPEQIEHWQNFMGRELTGVVVDHATHFHGRQFEGIQHILDRVRDPALTRREG